MRYEIIFILSHLSIIFAVAPVDNVLRKIARLDEIMVQNFVDTTVRLNRQKLTEKNPQLTEDPLDILSLPGYDRQLMSNYIYRFRMESPSFSGIAKPLINNVKRNYSEANDFPDWKPRSIVDYTYDVSYPKLLLYSNWTVFWKEFGSLESYRCDGKISIQLKQMGARGYVRAKVNVKGYALDILEVHVETSTPAEKTEETEALGDCHVHIEDYVTKQFEEFRTMFLKNFTVNVLPVLKTKLLVDFKSLIKLPNLSANLGSR